MTGIDAYKIWSKAAGRWSGWVRPVPFISPCLDALYGGAATDRHIDYAPSPDCAVIVDAPEDEGVAEALALARLGMRPVPLYNGTKAQDGTRSLVDNGMIERALLAGATELSAMSFEENAPPVFVLDSNRMLRFKLNVSVFDNSWDIYPQDMPTGAFLSAQGIKRIDVRTPRLNKDLKAILKKYKRCGIRIFCGNKN